MAEESKTLWLVPTYRSYKNGDMILTATMMNNENDKKSLKKYKKIRRESRRIRKSQRILFTDFRNSYIFQKNFKMMKLQNVPPFNIHEHNTTINYKSNSQVKISFSDILHSKHLNTTNNLYSNLSWKVYRCQLSSQDESCCCSCNSDAMFEVMKSLYDCYKKKNCDNCNCILCGHLPREERRLGELRKSGEEVTVGRKEMLSKKKLKSKTLPAIDYTVKGSKEKEQIFKEMALAGKPLPEAKNKSEKDLIRNLRTQLGLPQEPVTSDDKKKMSEAYKAGLIRPLEGKTEAEKEQILKKQAAIGIPLPEGRTPSEKALIAKVKETILKDKADGLLTPIEGKSKQEKERILKGLAKRGLPLPEAKTASDKKLMDRIRNEVGLPPEPKTASAKENYDRAMAAGLITPLEGKSTAKKEKILRDQAKMGLLLPEGRTPSEKALIEKVKVTTLPEKEVRMPSEKIRKAKAEGLLTPLEGKSNKEKERILRGLAKRGLPLPEAKTASDKKLMDRIRNEVGLPPEPKTASAKENYDRAMAAGLITPLEGKSTAKKEKILRDQAKMGLLLPEGRTPSEKALIEKVKETTLPEKEVRMPSEKIRKAKAEGLLTPLEGKSNKEKERILKGLAKRGLPLPEAKTASDQKLMDRIRNEVGLPPEPKTASAKENYDRAMAAGLITPLEGKSTAKKEKILRDQAKMGLLLPEGRTPSEKALIEKVKETTLPEKEVRMPSEKIRKAKAEGLLTPLEGKSNKEKERILKGLAKRGLPLPEAKTASDQKLMDRIRNEVGLPPEPKTASAKENYDRAMAAGLITPLEGKSTAKKEKILRDQAKMGLLLPEGRTPSEKALIEKVKETTLPEKEVRMPSEKIRKAKAEGLLTPLEGKSNKEKERILKGLAKRGLPLPEAKTASDQKLMDRIRNEVGLPPEPKTASAKENYDRAMAAGLITPLEGKSTAKKEKILRDQAKMGLLLPEGRTPSEKALIEKVKETTLPEKEMRMPSEIIRKAKAEGLLTPLEGKSNKEKERIIKGLAKRGLPLPEAKTASDQKLMDRIRNEVGLPPEPKTASAKAKYDRAMAAGLITPLEGKSIAKKERILRDQAKMGLLLPEGRTPSEKALIEKAKATSPYLIGRPSLTPEKIKKLDTKTAKVMKEKKGPSDKCICDLLTPESEKQPMGIGFIKMPTKKDTKIKVPSEKLRKAKADGLLTPLEGKNKKEKERILRGLVKHSIPLPEAKTASEQKLMDKIRTEVGLPPEPKTPSAKAKYESAMAAGIISPLDAKSMGKKEQILRDQVKMGLELPEGRTPSEKSLIAKVKATTQLETRVPSERIRKAKAEGLLSPLEGKSKQEKQRILKSLAKQGLPLPEPKTKSDQKLMDEIRYEVGLPPVPKTLSAKAKYNKAMAAGIITPLEGKSISKKEKILKEQAKLGLPLPEGKTPSEKALIAKVKESTRPEREMRVPLEKINKAKAEGLLSPLQGKSQQEKERILKGLVKHGLPLPEAKSESEQKLIDKVRNDVGLPSQPKTLSAKAKYDRAMAAGLITPLEGKSIGKKEQILRDQAKIGLQLPEGRTPSEKALIAKVKETTGLDKEVRVPSEKMRKAKAEGLLTPLIGKSKKEKERIIKGLIKHSLPLPEAKTVSEQKLIDKIRNEVGLPPEPRTSSAKLKYHKALTAGLITPLEGKSMGKKEKILRDQAKMGLELPEGRTPSEKSLIAKVKATTQPKMEMHVPSERIRKAKAEGLLSPLEGKSKQEKQRILRGLAKQGLPLPEPITKSDQKLIDEVRNEVGLPPVPKTLSAKAKYNRAMAAGIITPLEGKSMRKKEQILRDQAKMGLPLPEGRSPSEKALIEKVKATSPYLIGRPALKPEKLKKLDTKTAKVMKEKKGPSDECICDLLTPESEKQPGGIGFIKLPTKKDTPIKVPSEKMRKAKADGLLTPLKGKTKKEKERILRGLAKNGIPLPEAKTASDQKLIDKIRTEVGLPPEPKTSSGKAQYDRAMAAGIISPLEGKNMSRKEQILWDQAKMGLPLPEGRTISEKALIAKVKESIRPEKGSHVPSEKIRKAKAEGLLTPLDGKSKKEKEKILKGLAKQGIPFPEAKNASDQKLMNRIRTEIGLPPEPKTPSAKVKYDSAIAAGLITPLEGKSVGKKERILRNQAKMGLPLPEGRTTSEKALIAKVKETTKKEVSLAPSEIPIFPETASKKEILRKAKAAGILTPLKGKSLAQKEKILKGLADAGLPMPEGATPSEKVLVQKVRAMAGLPSETTPSAKKGKIKRRSKKIGDGGLIEEFEDINKNTTCDKGCGCDKKKIRFKHSYVKIRVTSPDISSLCPCPEECVPGVKGGVFTDNEGIKVTIGRATGIPAFPSREFRKLKRKIMIRPSDTRSASSVNNGIDSSWYYSTSNVVISKTNTLKMCSYESSPLVKSYENIHKDDNIRIIKSFSSYYEKPQLLRNEATEEFYSSQVSSSSSIETIYLIQSDSCLSLTTASEVYSVISLSVTGTSSYSDYNIREDYLNMEYEHINKSNENRTVRCTSDSALSIMNVSSTGSYWTSKILSINPQNKYEQEILILKCIHSESSQSDYFRKQRRQRFLMNFKDINSNQEILDTVSEVLSKISLVDSSTLIVLLPSSSNESPADSNDHNLDVIDSYLVVKVSENYAKRNYTHEVRGLGRNKGIKLVTTGKISKDVQSIEVNENGWCATGNVTLHEKQDKIFCPTSQIIEQRQRFFSTDTTEDRPCCCLPTEGRTEVKRTATKEQNSNNDVSMISKEADARDNTTCSACERSKFDDISGKETKSEKKAKSYCPCSFGYQAHPSLDTNDTWKGKSTVQKEKKNNKRNKNLKCECAQEVTQLLPEFQFSEEDWIDDAQVRKINSDLTQAVSGFKFNVLRKKPQPEMSFEEILKFYADSYEKKYKNLNYINTGKLQTETNAAAACECPPATDCVCPADQQEPSASGAEEPLQGIKFHIGGKGSGSKGLTGILCF